MGKIKLSEILDLFNGFAFKSTDYVDKSNVLNCRMSNIRPDGRFDILYNPRYLPENYADKFSNYKLRDGDLIVAMTDLAGDPKILGVPTIVQTNGTTILLNQRVGKLILKEKEKIFVPWLRYNLGRKEVQKYYSRFSNGGLQINLGKNDLLSYEIEITPLSTQKAIADKLDKADALRKKDKELLAQYDELAQAIFIDMFGDPVRNEKGWETENLSDIGKIGRGKSKHRPRNAPELLGGDYPLIQTGDVANSGLYINNYNSTYSQIGLLQSKMWSKGTLCITIAANIAKTGILNFDSCFPDSVVGFVPNEKTNVVYIHYWFSFVQKILEDQAPESAQKNINLEILSNLEIICPPIKLQNEFAEKIQNIEAQTSIVNQQAQQSEELFQALLQESFNFN